ncbi:MAG: protoheme IX farnesyltransferase [Elusimicrobia bacterium]|nr:protoheme IX farnesyltransferase [Elusimicrobiota bacterium]
MIGEYWKLTKPRITTLVAATACIGFYLGGGAMRSNRLFFCLAGTALASAAAGALNQYLERKRDGLMRRTAGRPLPRGRIDPVHAAIFGVSCAVLGLGLLSWKVNGLAGVIAGLTLFFYLALYTPFKTRTPHSTWIGAVAGAAPPLIGWAGASGRLSSEAWVLFAIQFLWQIPHFMSLFWLYREDYARAGFRVMPVVDPAGKTTSCQIALHSFALLPASLMPTFCGMAGTPYGCGALTLGAAFLGLGMRASWTMNALDTRRLFLASLAYLPLLLGMLVVGRT